jgi:hypothetical protein
MIDGDAVVFGVVPGTETNIGQIRSKLTDQQRTPPKYSVSMAAAKISAPGRTLGSFLSSDGMGGLRDSD